MKQLKGSVSVRRKRDETWMRGTLSKRTWSARGRV